MLQIGDRLERVEAEIVSANYFGVMRLSPAAGRFFRPDEDLALNSGPVCVLSERFWRVRLGRDPGVLGSTALANRVPLTVVGIVPAPFLGSVRGEEADVWIPLSMYPRVRFAGVSLLFSKIPPSEIFDDPQWQWLDLVGRLASDVSLTQATSKLGVIAAGLPSLEVTGQRDLQTLVASIDMTGHVDSTPAGAAFTRMLLDRLAAVPGVEAASLAHSAPIERRTSSLGGFLLDGRSDTPPRGFQVPLNVVSPDYFSTLGIPIRRGRVFSDHDPPGSSAGIVINESAARAYWPGRDALGQRLQRMATPGREAMALEVIGIVADSRYASIDQPIGPLAYFLTEHPVTLQVMPEQRVIIRTAGDPMGVLPELQAVVRTIDPTMALLEPMHMSERVARVTSVQRTMATVVAMFGLLALILAAVGVYGVLTQVVLERTREIGVRMALGAQRRQVLAMVARSAGRLVVAGLAAGLAVAAGAGRFVASLLFGVAPADPFTLTAVACGLGAVAMAAAFIPARRAASVDPAVSLKAE